MLAGVIAFGLALQAPAVVPPPEQRLEVLMFDGGALGPQLHWDAIRYPTEWRFVRWCVGPVCGAPDGNKEIHGRLDAADTAKLDALIARKPPPPPAPHLDPQTDCGRIAVEIDRLGVPFRRDISGCEADDYVSAMEAILKRQP